LKEIGEMEKKALNRPVSDLARTGEKELIDVITSHSANRRRAASCWATAAVTPIVSRKHSGTCSWTSSVRIAVATK